MKHTHHKNWKKNQINLCHSITEKHDRTYFELQTYTMYILNELKFAQYLTKPSLYFVSFNTKEFRIISVHSRAVTAR